MTFLKTICVSCQRFNLYTGLRSITAHYPIVVLRKVGKDVREDLQVATRAVCGKQIYIRNAKELFDFLKRNSW